MAATSPFYPAVDITLVVTELCLPLKQLYRINLAMHIAQGIPSHAME